MQTMYRWKCRLGAALGPLLLAAGCGIAAEAPKAADVEKVLKERFGESPPGVVPAVTVTLNAVKFGGAARATAQEVQVEGIPERSDVTPAIVDFTVRTRYTGETQALRRMREARVYRDKMGEWTVMTGSVRGTDTRVVEKP